jgi:hydroxyacylglutathione hydrolase
LGSAASACYTFVMAESVQVLPIACLRDNYAYLVFGGDPDGGALVVDPSEAAPVRRALEERGLYLAAILNTHHHHDHVGGNLELLRTVKVPVYAHESDAARIPGFSHGLAHGQTAVVAGIEFEAHHVPGHTTGALAYQMGDVCFTGDTLFCGGCGRLFEGTAAMMHDSLTRILGTLDGDVIMYCGHEYTLSNLEFAHAVHPHPALASRLTDVRARRAKGLFCASAPLATERSTNPYLLCHLPELQAALGASSEGEAFAALRKKKDHA